MIETRYSVLAVLKLEEYVARSKGFSKFYLFIYTVLPFSGLFHLSAKILILK
jgi:hypothetical protein